MEAQEASGRHRDPSGGLTSDGGAVRRTSDCVERSSEAAISVERLGHGLEGRRGAASTVCRGRGGAHFIGLRGCGEEASRPAAVEYKSPSASNELRGRGGGATSFQWGSDGGRAALQFGSPHAEEGATSGGARRGNAGRASGGG
jgi:hypothetical protein